MIERMGPDCLSEYRLELFVLQLDSTTERAEADAHLQTCAACRHMLSTIEAEHSHFSRGVTEAPDWLVPSGVPKRAMYDARRAVLDEAERMTTVPSFWERWGWRWAAGAAFCGMVFVLFLSWKAPDWLATPSASSVDGPVALGQKTPSHRRKIGRLGLSNRRLVPIRKLSHQNKSDTPGMLRRQPQSVSRQRPPVRRLFARLRRTVTVRFVSNVSGVRVYLNGRWFGVIMEPSRPLTMRLHPSVYNDKMKGRLVAVFMNPHLGGYTPQRIKRRVVVRRNQRQLTVRAFFRRPVRRGKQRASVPRCFRAHRGSWKSVVFRAPAGTRLRLLGKCRGEVLGVIGSSGRLERRMPVGAFVRVRLVFGGGAHVEKEFMVIRGHKSQVLSFAPPAACSLQKMQKKVQKGNALTPAETGCLYRVEKSDAQYAVAQSTLAWDVCLSGMYLRGRSYLFRAKRVMRASVSMKHWLWMGRSWLACRSYALGIKALRHVLKRSKKGSVARREALRFLSKAHVVRYRQRNNPHDLSQAISFLRILKRELPLRERKLHREVDEDLQRYVQLRRFRSQPAPSFAPPRR